MVTKSQLSLHLAELISEYVADCKRRWLANDTDFDAEDYRPSFAGFAAWLKERSKDE